MTTSAQPLIRFDGVKKIFHTDEVETHALSDINLEINEGEYVTIAGPSGCGKSTLLSILGLLDTPSDGTYLLGDKSVEDLDCTSAPTCATAKSDSSFRASISSAI